METTLQLPSNYRVCGQVDFKGDRKAKWIITGLSIAVTLLLFYVANLNVPILLLFYDAQGLLLPLPTVLIKVGVILLFMLFYVIIHEKLHGYFMTRFSKTKSRFGFNGSMAYAASDAYFSRTHFRIIVLAPVAILAAAIFIVTLLLPVDWFWVGYILQMFNLAGSMADFYTAWQIRSQPVDVLIQDSGAVRTFYAPFVEPEDPGASQKKTSRARQRQMQKIYGKKRKK